MVYLLSVSVFQVLKLFSPGRVSVYLCPSWRLCTAGFTAPALPMLSAPPLCLESAPALPAHLTSTVFWSCLIKTICFSLAIGSRAFCTVTHTLYNPFAHPSCTSLLFILLFIKPQYTVFCTSYCFALFIPLHILLLFLFFYHIYARVVTFIQFLFLFFCTVH